MKKSKSLKLIALVLVVFTVIQMLGAVGISATSAGANRTEIEIPEGKQAVYTAKINRARIDKVAFKLGKTEMFSITSAAMKICESIVQGKYAEGEYFLTMYINPTQQMFLVEVTLPGGGTVVKGTSEIEDYSNVTISASKVGLVSDVALKYENINVADYKVNENEPADPKNFYNFVSSFNDASHDRLFAFTADEKFVGKGSMAVRYREKGAADWTVVDAVKAEEKTAVPEIDYFKAEITGLKADTAYEYQIGKKGSTSSAQWSKVFSFTTAKEELDEFSFIAVGDTQGYQWEHFKYADAALNEAIKKVPNPAFILHTGDVVDSGYQAYQWKRYFKSLGDYGTNIANFVAIGNHDTRTVANDKLMDNDVKNNFFSFYFNHPDAPSDALVMDPAIYEKLSDSGKVQVDNFNETIYSYDYGNAHFIVLNTGTYVNTGNETYPDDKYIIEAQKAWLEKDLEANKDAAWTIIMCHEPMYHQKAGKQDRKYLTDIVEKYGVDLVIQGHSHLYTRSYPMKDGKIVTKTVDKVIDKEMGTIYVTIGATTPDHSAIAASTVETLQKLIFSANDQPVYTTVSIKGNKLTFTTRQINGLVLDTFTIKGEGVSDDELTEDVETNVPDVSATDAPATTPEGTGDTGCGSYISVAGLATVALLATCTSFVSKKKED
ncbi:MAG: metallophosphoesterase family protein [Clostridia bacterium]|nr:metallophosphoesterase family protein [Clostridia bacterium]